MAGLSTYLAQKLIGHVHQGLAYSVPAGTWLALFTADPTDDNLTANEVSQAWYSRQQITSWSAPTGTGQKTHNSNVVTFPAVTGASVQVSHWAIYDAVTDGNMLESGPLPSAKLLDIDDIYQLEAGDIEVDWGYPST